MKVVIFSEMELVDHDKDVDNIKTIRGVKKVEIFKDHVELEYYDERKESITICEFTSYTVMGD